LVPAGKVFVAWMPEQIEAFGFVEHQDFEMCFPNSGSGSNGGQNRKEYLISVGMVDLDRMAASCLACRRKRPH